MSHRERRETREAKLDAEVKKYFNLDTESDFVSKLSEMPEQEQNILTQTEILYRLAEFNLIDEKIHGWEARWLKRPEVYEHHCMET